MSIDHAVALLERLVANLQAAAARFSANGDLSVSVEDVQFALEEVLGFEDRPGMMIHEGLTLERIEELLAGFEFSKFHPVVLATVELDESILPGDLPRRLEEKQVKVGGEVWLIHQNDADPFPSRPHAHNKASGVSLDLKTGLLYQKRQHVGQVRKKHLSDLLEKAKIDVSSIESLAAGG